MDGGNPLSPRCAGWIVWLFAYIQWKTIQVALGQADGLGSAFLPVFLVVLTATAIYFTILCTGDAKDEKKGRLTNLSRPLMIPEWKSELVNNAFYDPPTLFFL